ncbi:TIGR04086 family membrane protein [Terrilactibacillus sp. S3-3]|nr:TIGR04086 family membrane protein [Terrilactibacillus sp. S3-3]
MSRRLFTAAGYGMIAAFIIVLFSAFFLATLLRFTSLAESSLTLAPSIISLTALFIGGLISGMKMKKKKGVIGLLTGLSYCLLIMCIQFPVSRIRSDGGRGSISPLYRKCGGFHNWRRDRR